jgi:hypothetical protein
MTKSRLDIAEDKNAKLQDTAKQSAKRKYSEKKITEHPRVVGQL